MTKSGRISFYLIIFISTFLIFDAQILFAQKSDGNVEGKIITSADTARTLKALNGEIKEIISDKGLRQTDIGILIYSLDNNKIYYEKNMDKYLTPASVTKVVTSFAALVDLGAEYKIKTQLYSDADVVDGVLNGNLYIVGKGDALFSSADLEKMVEIAYSYGIREIKGNIYADGSYFDDMTSRFKYSGDRDIVQSIPEITALSIEKNTFTILANAGSKNKSRVDVRTIPPSNAFSIHNSAIVFGGKGRKKRGPKDMEISITASKSSKGGHVISVKGGLKANTTDSKTYDLNDAVYVVAGALFNRLKARGIKIQGEFDKMAAPDSANILVAEFGRPLKEILRELNKNSDNYLAESVFKLIGAHYGKYDNTAKSARERIQFILDSMDVPCSKCRFNGGSGLSRRNLTTAQALVRILEIASENEFGKYLPLFLSNAGVDGTLKNRMKRTRAENNVKAKTGTLRNVSALAGYVHTLDNENLAFAVFLNGPHVGNYKRAENNIAILLSNFFFYNDVE